MRLGMPHVFFIFWLLLIVPLDPCSCGVSRIWVSPLHRRSGIASKLLRAVQYHTVLGQEIPMERIAFSTPTDDGRALARHVTGLDNFLTYDQ